MSAHDGPPIRPDSMLNEEFPPVVGLGMTALALVVVGGIIMASYVPRTPPLLLPGILLAVAVVLLVTAMVLMARRTPFAWAKFFLVARWAFLAYAVSAGMIAYAFVKDHTPGAPLAVLLGMLAVFAIDVPLMIAFTVARYERVEPVAPEAGEPTSSPTAA